MVESKVLKILEILNVHSTFGGEHQRFWIVELKNLKVASFPLV